MNGAQSCYQGILTLVLLGVTPALALGDRVSLPADRLALDRELGNLRQRKDQGWPTIF